MVSSVKRNVALLLLHASEMRRHVTSEMCFTVNILHLDFRFTDCSVLRIPSLQTVANLEILVSFLPFRHEA